MADRWMDERDRRWRDRDWRRSEDYGRGEDERRYEGGEGRSWGRSEDDQRGAYGARRSGSDRDRVFGERETGMGYGGEEYGSEGRSEGGGRTGGARSGGGAYGAGGSYGGGEGYGRGSGRSSAYRGEGERYGGSGRGYGQGQDDRASEWQDRDYGGVSPAMEHHEYDAERRAEQYQREHDVRGRRSGGQGGYGGYGGDRNTGRDAGGRYYGDAGRERIYREEWSQGARDTGPAPRGYDAGRDSGYGQRDYPSRRDFGSGQRSYDSARQAERQERRPMEDYSTMFSSADVASGGTGGYDYERGYGDGGRQRYADNRFDSQRDQGRDRDRDWGRRDDGDRGERFERTGREAGDFFRRAGERVASWFGGGETRRDENGDRGFQGMGPKGYQRSDERINEEAHERLTDDDWVDASNVSVSVSGGEVTLSGTVENREAKHRAERIVEDVAGVRHVQNNLRVEKGNPLTTPGSGYGDSVLQSQMRDAETGNKSGVASTTSTSTDTGKSR